MEYLKGGSLKDALNLNRFKGYSECYANIIKQICQGLNYLHNKNIFHRDIKCDNILLNNKSQYPIVKLGDFGLSCIVNESKYYEQNNKKNGAGDLFYRSPEALKGEKYGPGDDMWALGIIILELMNEKTLTSFINNKSFANYVNKDEYIEQIIEDYYIPNKHGFIMEKDQPTKILLQKIVRKLLLINYKNRLSANDIINILSNNSRKILLNPLKSNNLSRSFDSLF